MPNPFGDKPQGLPERVRYIRVRNLDSSAIPAYACLEVVSYDQTPDSGDIWNVRRPTSATNSGDYVFCDRVPIPGKGTGQAVIGPWMIASFLPGSSPPANGQIYGAASGSYDLVSSQKGYIVRDIVDSTRNLMVVSPSFQSAQSSSNQVYNAKLLAKNSSGYWQWIIQIVVAANLTIDDPAGPQPFNAVPTYEYDQSDIGDPQPGDMVVMINGPVGSGSGASGGSGGSGSGGGSGPQWSFVPHPTPPPGKQVGGGCVSADDCSWLYSTNISHKKCMTLTIPKALGVCMGIDTSQVIPMVWVPSQGKWIGIRMLNTACGCTVVSWVPNGNGTATLTLMGVGDACNGSHCVQVSYTCKFMGCCGYSCARFSVLDSDGGVPIVCGSGSGSGSGTGEGNDCGDFMSLMVCCGSCPTLPCDSCCISGVPLAWMLSISGGAHCLCANGIYVIPYVSPNNYAVNCGSANASLVYTKDDATSGHLTLNIAGVIYQVGGLATMPCTATTLNYVSGCDTAPATVTIVPMGPNGETCNGCSPIPFLTLSGLAQYGIGPDTVKLQYGLVAGIIGWYWTNPDSCLNCWQSAQITCQAGILHLTVWGQCAVSGGGGGGGTPPPVPAGPMIDMDIGYVDCSNLYVKISATVNCLVPLVCACITSVGPFTLTISKSSS